MTEPFKINGLAGASYLYFIARHFKNGLVILPDDEKLQQEAETLAFFVGQADSALAFPAFERMYEPIRQEPQTAQSRLFTQWRLLQKRRPRFVLAHRSAL